MERKKLNSTGSSKLSGTADNKMNQKALQKPFLVSGRWDMNPGTVQSSAMVVPTQEITEVVVCLGNSISFAYEWGTKHGHHLHWLDGKWPSWPVSSLTPHSFPPQTFYYLPTEKIKNRKYSFITVPWTKILQIPCKAFIIINIQIIPPCLQQLFMKISSCFHSEWVYDWNYVIKSAKIYALGRLNAIRLSKTFEFWISTQKHCS